MQSSKGIVFVVLSCIAMTVLPMSWCIAQTSVSSWDCLPTETLGAMRVPNGQAYVDTFVKNTKFGAVMFSEQRKAAVAKILEESDSQKWQEFQEKLEEYELSVSDLLRLFTGESGYALAMKSSDDEKPQFIGLGWIEPGEELTQKVYSALQKMLEEQEGEQLTERIDLQLADQTVMQLQVPDIQTEYKEEFDVGEGYDDLSEEEQDEAWDKAYEKWQDSAYEVVTHRTVLVSQLGGRLLVGHHFDSYNEEQTGEAAEQLSKVFGRWLAAHTDDSGDFVERFADDLGAARVMALEGETLLEMLGQTAPLVELLKTAGSLQANRDKLVRLLGVEELGPFAMRVAWQGNGVSKTRVSLAVPEPRKGAMRLFDQDTLPTDPPAWVPANVLSYSQFSFDFGKAYEIIKEEIAREFPDLTTNQLALVEAQVQGFAQASLPEVLSSLGNQHTVLSFGAASGEDANAPGAQRLAFVWQVEDEQLWQRLLTAITPLAGLAPGVESAEEQGFSGWRMKSNKVEGGLFAGKGYLVLGFGSGVIESVLSSLNNPPTGSDAFRGSEIFTKASTMLNLGSAIALQVVDDDRETTATVSTLRKLVENAAESIDSSEDDGIFTALAEAILPSQKEIEGTMGVTVSRWEVNEDGVFIESASEMAVP